MLEILKSGGFWIIPIILSAMVATFIIIERLIYYRIHSTITDNALTNLSNKNYNDLE